MKFLKRREAFPPQIRYLSDPLQELTLLRCQYEVHYKKIALQYRIDAKSLQQLCLHTRMCSPVLFGNFEGYAFYLSLFCRLGCE